MTQATETIVEPGPKVCIDCKHMIYSYPQWFHEWCHGGNGLSHNVADWAKLLVGQVCPECLLPKPEDDRVLDGRKCGECAGYGTDPDS